MDFNGKVVLVTGGAKGIGQAIAKAFALQNAIVVINYNSSSQAAAQFQSEMQSLGHTVHILQGNVANYQESEALVQKTVELCGRLDILVNNAGITKDTLILRMNETDFDQVIDTNLKGAWNMSKHALKVMAKQRYGRIVNISSVVGLIGSSGQSNYAASKAGLLGLTKSLAREYAKRGITINAIAPGFIQTQMTEVLDSAVVDYYLAQIPMGRVGQAEEVAHAVCFLASEEASYITGQVLTVDGGLVMS